MNRYHLGIGLSVVVCTICAAGPALAQRAADSKVRGDAYYLYLGEIYRGHAGDHAFILNEFSATGQPVPKDIVAEHAGAIRANVAASQKAYGKLSAAVKKDPKAAAHLDEIDKHHSAVLEMCDKLDAEASKDEGDSSTVCGACEEILKNVDAADEVHKRLAKQLRIKPLE